MLTPDQDANEIAVAVVMPAYNEERAIGSVLAALPRFIKHIVVVDDHSSDRTAAIIAEHAKRDPRIVVCINQANLGVGGATLRGFEKVLELGAHVVVKIDADGQCRPEHLMRLVEPLIRGEADYAKGNRFRHLKALRAMPLVRRIGNIFLTFMAKIATGYWDLQDPTNGFVAIRTEVLAELPLARVAKSFFFEHSMLSHLYLLGAVVKDVPLPSRYGDEVSHLRIQHVVFEFPIKLLGSLVRRLFLRKFVYDFRLESLYAIVGSLAVGYGLWFGQAKYQLYSQLQRATTPGNVMISALLIIVGFQLLLTAVTLDMQSVPREPLCGGRLPGTLDV